MTIDHDKVKHAEAYTAAWNSGSTQAVAEFYAQDGQIVINRGEPWEGRTGVAEMAAAFLPTCLTSTLFAMGCAAPAIMSSTFGPLQVPIPGQKTPCALSDGRNGILMRTTR